MPLPSPCCESAACPPAPGRTLEDRLTRLIVTSIKPKSWSEMGGPGTMDYYPLGQALVVKQTPEVHEQIAELLAALRRLQDVEVAVEVRLISVSASLYEQLVSGGCSGQNFRAEAVPGTQLQCYTASCREPLLRCSASGGASTTCLNHEQMRQFLQAAQEDPRTNVMQAPKMTLLNGQTATCNITDRLFFVTGVTAVQAGGQIVACPQNESFTTGLQMSVQPLVSTDRRSVYVNLKLNQTNLATAAVPLFPVVARLTPEFEGGAKGEPVPFTQYIQQPRFNTFALERSLKIREGGTVVLSGWKQESEGRTEFGPPVLSKIPYLNRFFKNVGYGRDTSYVLVMVTPRVIVNEEEESRMTGGASPTTAPTVLAPPPCCPNPVQPCCVPSCPASEQPASEALLPSREATAAKLLRKYQKACSAGHLDEAEMLARQALALDPACFSKPAARAAGKSPGAPMDR
jgi:type II secretory pathway component GspD/PulD (secretin)